MRILRDLSAIPESAQHAVVALGNFDGVHLGHQAILRSAVALAHASGQMPAAMTFEPHPREFFGGFNERLRLYPFRAKVELMAELGIECLFVVRFNRAFSTLPAETFTHEILHRQLAVSHIVTGTNFYFGHGRKGHQQSLAEAADELEFGYTAHPPVHAANGQLVSSSAIRDALAAGDLSTASIFLGRPYAIEGRVRHGERRGRLLGFPTLNLSLDKLFLPRKGVYAARVLIDGIWVNAVANIGVKPTFGHHAPLLEAHCFDFDRDCYGKLAKVELIGYIRGEQKFSGIDALKLQISEDCQQAKIMLAANHCHSRLRGNDN